MDWLLKFDMETFRYIHLDLSNPFLDVVMLVLSYSGLGQVQAGFVLLLLAWKRTRFYVLPLLVTIVVSGTLVAQGLKAIMDRERPSNLMIAKPAEAWLSNSFPSGHTTTSVAVATMLFLITFRSRNAWIGKLALVWALLVGISRIYRGVHWPTDVLAGICAGTFTSCAVYLVLHAMGRQLRAEELVAGSVSTKEEPAA